MSKRNGIIKRLPQQIPPGLRLAGGHFGTGVGSMGKNRNRTLNLHRPEWVRLAPQRRYRAEVAS